MLSSRLKTRPHNLFKLTALSVMVAALSGCGEDAKDCGGFWDKTFGREECSATPTPVPQAPLGQNVVQNNVVLSASAQQVVAGQTVQVTSFIDSSSGLNGQIKTDAQADIISVMRGDEILLMQPVLDGQPQTTDISFESTALQLVLMDAKFSGSDVAIRKAAIAKIKAHPQFSQLVSLVESALNSQQPNPLDAMVSPYLYDTAFGIANDIDLATLQTELTSNTPAPLAALMIQQAQKMAITVSEGVFSPAYASNNVLDGQQHMDADFDGKEISFKNKSMISYSAYDATTDGDNSYLLDPVEGTLEFFKAQKIPNAAKQEKQWSFKLRRLAEKKTDVAILKLIPNYQKNGQYQIQLMGTNWLYDDPQADFFDEVVARFDVTSARGKSNVVNLLNGASIIVGTVAATPKSYMSSNVVSALKKFEADMKAIKPHVKRIANFVAAANETCDFISNVTNSEAFPELKGSPAYISTVGSLCEQINTIEHYVKPLQSIAGFEVDESLRDTYRKRTLVGAYEAITGSKLNDKDKLSTQAIKDLAETAFKQAIKAAKKPENLAKIRNSLLTTITNIQNDDFGEGAMAKVQLLGSFVSSPQKSATAAFGRISSTVSTLWQNPTIAQTLIDWGVDGAKGGAKFLINYQKLSVGAGLRVAAKRVTLGYEIGNKLLPYFSDLLTLPTQMTVFIKDGVISKVPVHQSYMKVRVKKYTPSGALVGDEEVYDLAQRLADGTEAEPLDVVAGDEIEVTYSAFQPLVYNKNGQGDLVHESNASFFGDGLKPPTIVHYFNATLVGLNGTAQSLRAAALCVRNKALNSLELAYADSYAGYSKSIGYGACSSSNADDFFARGLVTGDLPERLGGEDKHTVSYTIKHKVQATDQKIVIGFSNYAATSSDAFAINLNTHQPATADSILTINDLGDAVTHLVEVGRTLSFELIDVIGDAKTAFWRVLDATGTQVASLQTAIGDVFKHAFSGSGNYTVEAQLKNEQGIVTGKQQTQLSAVEVSFDSVNVTTIPAGQAVAVTVNGKNIPSTAIFAFENVPCNAPMVNAEGTQLTQVCTVPAPKANIKLTVKRKSGVDEGSKVFYVSAAADKAVTGSLTVLANEQYAGYFVPPVNNEPVYGDSTVVLAYNGISKNSYQCTFNTTGQTKTYRSYDLVDANGYSADILPLMNNGYANMALLAAKQQGTESQTLLIGKSQTVTIAAGQTLNFYLNDDNYGDNEGALTVNYQCNQLTATIQPSTTSPVAQSPITIGFVDTVIENVKSVIWKVSDAVGDIMVRTLSGIGELFDYVFGKSGDYVVSATVKDSSNQTILTTSTQITVTAAPPVASLVGSDITGVVGQPVVFVLSNSKPQEGKLCSYTFVGGGEIGASGSGDCSNASQVLTLPSITEIYTTAGTFTATLTVTDSKGKSATATWLVNVSEALQTATSGLLNDTGITQCANVNTLFADCSAASLGGWFGLNQDGETGRDFLAANGQLTKVGAGDAGFDFTKISATGDPLPDSATDWRCVKDNYTGLLWEVKTTDGGLHDWRKTFQWYSPDIATNGGFSGYENGGNNTLAYVNDINVQGLCGYNDWRLPARMELIGLMDYSKPYPGPTIDLDYFPHTQGGYYWTSSPYSFNKDGAWAVDFVYGITSNYYEYWYYRKDSKHYVRLVRFGK